MSEEISHPPVRGESGIAGLVPFGLNTPEPHPYASIARTAWNELGRLGRIWQRISRSTCSCELGSVGLRDGAVGGPHICEPRIDGLHDQLAPAFPPADVAHIDRLRRLDRAGLRGLGRIGMPYLRRRGGRGFERVSWDAALELAGRQLRETPPEHTRWLASTGDLSNEAYYAFAKAALLHGSRELDLRTSSAALVTERALRHTLGYGAATTGLNDWVGTDLLLVWGADLTRTHPMAATYLARAKAAGTRVVMIHSQFEPRMTAAWLPTDPVSALFGARLLDDFVRIDEGGTQPLLQAVLKLLVRDGAVDTGFIEAHTRGWSAHEAHLRGLSLSGLVAASGTTIGQVEWLAQLIARSTTMVSVWSDGIATDAAVQELVGLHLARGAIGAAHRGLMPLHGTPGFRGARDCGVSSTHLPGARPESAAASLAELWGHPVPEARDGDAPETQLLVTLGADSNESEPNGTVGFRIHIASWLDPSMLVEPGEAVLVLPAATRHEQPGGNTTTTVDRCIRFSPRLATSPREARPMYGIPGDLVAAAHPELSPLVTFTDAQAVRDEMGRAMPRYAGIERLSALGDQLRWGGRHLGWRGLFPELPDNRARFPEPP